jgi:DNA-directed RNA polymerase
MIDRQLELEREYSDLGFAIHTDRMNEAELKGRASTNPYAKGIFRDYVPAIAAVIADTLNNGKPGRAAAHVTLLKGQDPMVVAFLTVRFALGLRHDMTLSQAVFGLGKAVYRDIMLAHIADELPDLYHVLSEDLDRRLSKDERHRFHTIAMQAQKNGMVIPKWPTAARVAVGGFLVGLLVAVEFVETEKQAGAIRLAQGVQDRMTDVKVACALTLPAVGPCVAPPLPRSRGGSGGFHSPRLQGCFRLLPTHVDVEFSDTVVTCVNALQDTAWQVNVDVLDVVRAVAQDTSAGEIVSSANEVCPRPPRPASIPEDAKIVDLGEADKKLMSEWKTAVRKWHEARLLNAGKYRRFGSALRVAEKFRDERAIYFVWFADSRGRLYPATSGGISPQGSDLQKALLRFAEGFPLASKAAERWFRINGANRWGFDKATLDEREAWSHERHDLLMLMGSDPTNNRDWMQADSPMQFLAWVMEYAKWQQCPELFVSHISIGMDGSCNGLQNLSACLRDEVGGKATNLTNNAVMEDIYKRVAEAATVRLNNFIYDDPAKEELRKLWVQTGFTRKLTKRSVMTTPYGVTRKTAETNLIVDNLRDGQAPLIPDTEHFRAAIVAMDFIWPAIGDVVVKGTQLMEWLKKGARCIIKEQNDPRIKWTTPSGFPASQTYYTKTTYRVQTHICGRYDLTVAHSLDDPDKSRHASGMAPNFVHSLDASHLHLTVAASHAKGIRSFHMVHDDFGTHAAFADTLFHTIREEFHAMYSKHDPVEEFRLLYPYLPVPPTRGTLDLDEVLESDFFFS